MELIFTDTLSDEDIDWDCDPSKYHRSRRYPEEIETDRYNEFGELKENWFDRYDNRPNKKKRPNFKCLWEHHPSGDKKLCQTSVYKKDLCKKHYTKAKGCPEKECFISSCDNKSDSYGDWFCERCGLNNGRPKCKTEGCPRSIWSSKIKTEHCKQHDPKKQCHKGCTTPATIERYGKYYCNYHSPVKKECKHVNGNMKCRTTYYTASDDPKTFKCHKHGGKQKRKFASLEGIKTGICGQDMGPGLHTGKKCKQRTVRKSDFCHLHGGIPKCEFEHCDKLSLDALDNLCEDHLPENQKFYCEKCNELIRSRKGRHKCHNEIN